jgi:two-component system, cell cycle response regulator DivK
LAGELILVVEDNEKNLKLTRAVLRLNGYRTLEARTAEQGLALANTHLPQLILLDVQLPGMDGIGALERLKAEPRTASIPVIALTAFAMKEDPERFARAGFDGYMAKPIDVDTFADQVRTYCDRAEQET